MPNPKLETYKNKATGTVYDFTDADAQSKVTATVDLLKDTVGWVGKNLLRFPYSEGTLTRNGITWTVNSDGTVTANGTATSDEVFAVYDGMTLPRDIPLTVVGGVSNNVYLYVNGRKNGQYVKTYVEQRGEPKEFIILSTDDVDEIYVRLRINVNQTVNNLVFYPMICRSDEYALSPDFELYHESVEDWYWNNNAKTGVHQLLPIKIDVLKANNSGGSWDGNACTINGVTYTCTVDSNNNVTAIATSGTASGDSTFFILGKGWNYANTVENILDIGEYILSDDVNEYTGNKNVPNVRMYGYTSGGSAWSLSEITPNTNKTFTIDATAKACHISVYIRVPDGQTTNKIFKPMIRYAEDTVDKFGIYAMTNRELTEMQTGLNKQLNSGLLTTLDAFLAAASKPESGNLIYVSGDVVSVLTNNELSASGKLTVFNLTGGTFDWYGMIGAERFACGRLSNNQYSSHTIIK